MTTLIRKMFFLSCFMATLILNNGCTDKRPVTIGIVNTNPGLEGIIKGFKEGMAEAGYVEGSNVIYLYKGTVRNAEVDAEIKEMLAKRADMLLTVTTHVTQRAKALTAGTNTPVVFAPVFFAIESGIVSDLKRPGGNLTGMQIGGNTQKALEWHLIAAPSRRMLVPYNDEEPAATQSLNELKEAARKLRIELVIVPVKDDDELAAAIKKNGRLRNIDSMWVLNSHFNIRNIKVFSDAGIKFKMPVSSGTSQLGLGMLLSYGQKPYSTGKKASRLASSILSGIPPREIPVETVDYYLGVNLATARAIGVNIPDEILAQAHEIVRK